MPAAPMTRVMETMAIAAVSAPVEAMTSSALFVAFWSAMPFSTRVLLPSLDFLTMTA